VRLGHRNVIWLRWAFGSDDGGVFIGRVGVWIIYTAHGSEILFRIADITKPWPASWADRKLGGGLGIMLDDIFAALFAAALLFVAHHYLG
jgi:phosphatidylglycerophosphatase A